MAQIDTLLEDLVARKGSDLHLSAGRKPVFRVSGALNDVPDSSPLTSDDVLAMMREILPEENIAQLQRDWDTDCAYAIPGLARFRVNAYRDMNGVCAVLRVIPDKIPTFEDLNLPEALRSFCLLSKGLPATLHGHSVNNIFRADVPVEGLPTEVATANAPERIEDEIRMPRVVE